VINIKIILNKIQLSINHKILLLIIKYYYEIMLLKIPYKKKQTRKLTLFLYK